MSTQSSLSDTSFITVSGYGTRRNGRMKNERFYEDHEDDGALLKRKA